ncbi:hypothetical protein K1T71_000085 [Dendrolimus kikuchii]|uniref:Uncharacterized protein n=1 Tax=Dendrolimus kikuchii TaxID=765133 RepID=A0ACC1DIE2_9NEOP|nr:hypothetical protein K1T71_000085 [Dendrolimus kikuchii]
MADNSKKRAGSFRKLFPSLFFKSKEKSKDSNKGANDLSRNNHNQSPRLIISDKCSQNEDSERIYENLTTAHASDNETLNIDIPSNHSSSSTLVSGSVKSKTNTVHVGQVIDKEYINYAARPQVPPKPNDMIPNRVNQVNYDNTKYPDVYYHSLEKLTDKISPLDEIEIYRASQVQANPASVGAEIKRVSTKFLISPKKEAEVRTIQPTRARSLSFDNKENGVKEVDAQKTVPQKLIKTYNYSAPTSPLPVNRKTPNIPKTVSPYGYVRKNMMETEEKRNSLSRTSLRNKTTPSPRNVYSLRTPPPQKEVTRVDEKDKEKTRQKVEAFYWQKLKELKQKEDDYLLRQSLRSPVRNATYSQSDCSTPTSFVVEPRTGSLPRGADFKNFVMQNQQIYSATPFNRGAPERRTDSFVKPRTSIEDSEIVYRNPEKLLASSPMVDRKMLIYGYSLPPNVRISQQPKRVSFEEKAPFKVLNKQTGKSDSSSQDVYKMLIRHETLNNSARVSDNTQGPPRPPVRTTSVGVQSARPSDLRPVHSGPGRSIYSESESGSEAGEIQRIMQDNSQKEEDWHGDGSRIDGGLSDSEANRVPSRSRSSRRDDPRRHTLAGNHLYVHPHHQNQINNIEMEPTYASGRVAMSGPEYAVVNKSYDMRSTMERKVLDPRMRKPPLPRGYVPPNNNLLFDDDPGIMSEVETASTGFRRGGKQRSSLPVVRTPSKTLERPLGLVFLQYRNETKRALLPNEITSIDTVKALFVRSFPKQLSMPYMDSPLVKIYIQDNLNMFYELEDDRAHLRDIRDRSVLRLFEATDIGGGAFPGAVGVGSLTMPTGTTACSGPPSWEDQSYFSEPEIDSEYHHQHVHKSKVSHSCSNLKVRWIYAFLFVVITTANVEKCVGKYEEAAWDLLHYLRY